MNKIYIFLSSLADGLKTDYSDLPLNQQLEKLESKIQELQQKIEKETVAHDGLVKMKTVYESNSALGNPLTIEGPLNESEHKLEKLNQELRKFEGYLDKALTLLANSNNENDNGHNRVSSDSNESYEMHEREHRPDDGREETYYEGDTGVVILPPIGTCRALHSFKASIEGSISMSEGEELHVIELDQGDGWTRARRHNCSNSLDDGFVPTSYIEITLHG